MPATPNYALPYPQLSDTADVPRDIQALAVKLDAMPGLAPDTAVPLVSVLPATPVDGQEVYFLANATDGVVWHLRWRTAGGFWECVGGPPLCTPPINDANTTGAGAAWSNQLGDGAGAVGITVPLPGDYFVTWNTTATNLVASTITTGAGVFRSNDVTTPFVSAVQMLNGNGHWGNCGGSGRCPGVLAGSRLNMVYLYGPNQIQFTRRNMSAMPIRVFKP